MVGFADISAVTRRTLSDIHSQRLFQTSLAEFRSRPAALKERAALPSTHGRVLRVRGAQVRVEQRVRAVSPSILQSAC